MARTAARILLVLLAVCLLLAVTLMTDRSAPSSLRPPPPEPLVWGRSEVLQPLPTARPRHRVPPRRVVEPARPVHRTPFSVLVRRAVARIPGYHGEATWRVTSRFGHWGVTDIRNAVVYISPHVPRSRLYDVVAHEWSHVLSVLDYGGDVPRALDALNRWYGGRGLLGAERAADCMAKLLGARWTGYTSCHDHHWREGARRLLAREAL